ncbi:alpha/beta fold hydrolase [Microlunatus speluncae]|uniref:alpha/beta fold hydrolase n=1 Tax=Microlunatus speluncae TaxID=2594267 RepID=UPI00137644FE|nr:alpha/beta hydrolase [Microlunatus speluncae]
MDAVEQGAFAGGQPYLAVGGGRPLVYLVGLSANHELPTGGLERRITLATIRPFAQAGYRVYLTNRPPDLEPGTSWADLADDLAVSLTERFGEPVDLIGHSSGGSQLLQLLADHPAVARKAVVASAAYRLGPIAKEAQLQLLANVEQHGRFQADLLVAGFVQNPTAQRLLNLPMGLAAPLIKIKSRSDLAIALRAEDAFDVYEKLPAISTETLVVYGGKDYFWTQEMFAETAARMPNATALCYPKAGHALTTSPSFFRDTLTFLA